MKTFFWKWNRSPYGWAFSLFLPHLLSANRVKLRLSGHRHWFIAAPNVDFYLDKSSSSERAKDAKEVFFGFALWRRNSQLKHGVDILVRKRRARDVDCEGIGSVVGFGLGSCAPASASAESEANNAVIQGVMKAEIVVIENLLNSMIYCTHKSPIWTVANLAQHICLVSIEN